MRNEVNYTRYNNINFDYSFPKEDFVGNPIDSVVAHFNYKPKTISVLFGLVYNGTIGF